MIDELLTGLDTSEAVAFELAAIVKGESISQMALATAAGEDAAPYDLRVFHEEFGPHDLGPDMRPIVSVHLVSTDPAEMGKSSPRRTLLDATYLVHVIGQGKDTSTTDDIRSGVSAAKLEARRAVRLARRWLFAGAHARVNGLAQSQLRYGGATYQPLKKHESQSRPMAVGQFTVTVLCEESRSVVQGTPMAGLSVSLIERDTGELIAKETL